MQGGEHNMALPHRFIATFAMVLCVHLAGAAAAHAAETWRCGNTYTDQPCAGGKAIDADDARSPAQVRAAESATRREQAAADRMARDRQRQEALAAGRPPAVINAPPQAVATEKPARAAKKKKPGANEPEYFSARDPQAAIARKQKRKSVGG